LASPGQTHPLFLDYIRANPVNRSCGRGGKHHRNSSAEPNKTSDTSTEDWPGTRWVGAGQRGGHPVERRLKRNLRLHPHRDFAFQPEPQPRPRPRPRPAPANLSAAVEGAFGPLSSTVSAAEDGLPGHQPIRSGANRTCGHSSGIHRGRLKAGARRIHLRKTLPWLRTPRVAAKHSITEKKKNPVHARRLNVLVPVHETKREAPPPKPAQNQRQPGDPGFVQRHRQASARKLSSGARGVFPRPPAPAPAHGPPARPLPAPGRRPRSPRPGRRRPASKTAISLMNSSTNRQAEVGRQRNRAQIAPCPESGGG